MKLDGHAIHYQLSKDYADLECSLPVRGVRADYPMLYDETADMSGHAVLVPGHERPKAGPGMENVMCVCTDAKLAVALEREGLGYVLVRDKVSFPQLYNSMLANYVRNERMDARLHAYVDTFAGFQPLVDVCAQTMGFPCALVDKDFRVVAAATGKDPSAFDPASSDSLIDLIGQDAFDLFAGSREYRSMRSNRKVFAVPGPYGLFMKNVFSKGKLVGTVLMRHDNDMLSARFVRFLLNYLTPFVEQMYGAIGSFARSQNESARIRDMLVKVLEGDEVDFERIDKLLLEDGHEAEARYALLQLDRSFSQEGAEGLQYLARRIDQTWTKSYSVVAGSKLYVLAYLGTQRREHDAALRSDLPELLRDIMAKAGVGRSFGSMAQLPAARTQAQVALEQGAADDPTLWYYHFDDYALPYLTKHGTAGINPRHVCHPAVVQLAAHDAATGSDLLHTLRVFMECRYNASLAAEKLFVARSTLLNRLARIEELTHVDLDKLEARAYLVLSFALIERDG